MLKWDFSIRKEISPGVCFGRNSFSRQYYPLAEQGCSSHIFKTHGLTAFHTINVTEASRMPAKLFGQQRFFSLKNTVTFSLNKAGWFASSKGDNKVLLNGSAGQSKIKPYIFPSQTLKQPAAALSHCLTLHKWTGSLGEADDPGLSLELQFMVKLLENVADPWVVNPLHIKVSYRNESTLSRYSILLEWSRNRGIYSYSFLVTGISGYPSYFQSQVTGHGEGCRLWIHLKCRSG